MISTWNLAITHQLSLARLLKMQGFAGPVEHIKRQYDMSSQFLAGLIFCFAMATGSAHAQNISTIAGDGTGGFSGDGGAATSAELESPFGVAFDSSGNIYLADTDNERIRKVTASTGVITTVAGDGTQGYSGDGGAATSAELSDPYNVLFYGSAIFTFPIRRIAASGR